LENNLGAKSNKMTILSFSSKVFYFLLVGLSGFIINYAISYSLVHGTILNIWYIHATLIGIAVSTTSNFLLNKYFTFRDRNFSYLRTLRQYGSYVSFTMIGTLIQLLVVWIFVEMGYMYSLSLILGVGFGALSNFLLNKKWTFGEKIWH